MRLPSRISLALTAFLGFASARLIHDYGAFGNFAIRDFTTALEMLFLIVGVWVVRRYGIDTVIRLLTNIFRVALGYFALYPIFEKLAGLPLGVGLQHAAPLLGQRAGVATAAGAGLFFFLFVRPVPNSMLYVAGFVGVVLMVQARGLFVAAPLSVLFVWVLAGPQASRMRSRLVALLLAACVVSPLMFLLAPQGRMGPVDPRFLVSQLQTLLGEEGPGSGSIQSRLDFIDETFTVVRDTPGGWWIGAGLGPDLAGGFSADAETGTLVRKPHDDYLEVLARFGVIGFALFIYVVFSLLRLVVRAARRLGGREQRVAWFVVASAVVYLVIAATQPLLAFPYGTTPLFVFLGIGVAMATSEAHVT